MPLSNELSSVLLKTSHLVARYTILSLYLTVLLITLCGVQAGAHILKKCWGLTLFSSHLSKCLSAVGSIFQTLCPLKVQYFKFTSVLSQVYFVGFRVIKIRRSVCSGA